MIELTQKVLQNHMEVTAIVEIEDGADITYNDPDMMEQMLTIIKKICRKRECSTQ